MTLDTKQRRGGLASPLLSEDEEVFPLKIPQLRPFPASGLYTWSLTLPPIPRPIPIPPIYPVPEPGPPIIPQDGPTARPQTQASVADTVDSLFFRVLSEEVRLDVDGRYPLMVVSGDMLMGLASTVHWIASLSPTARGTYAGPIWYHEPATTPFPYTSVIVETFGGFLATGRTVRITYQGAGDPRVRTYGHKSPYFHDVNFETDYQDGETAVASFDTGSHPNRPATLPSETLTVPTIYKRTGFSVTTTPGGPVPVASAGSNLTWSDQELHDAMQTYWSQFAPMAKWATWVFVGSQHDMGHSLGGIMFDDIGAQHRQGTAIFNNSFIADPPAGDPNSAAYVNRMKFVTMVHEMGHEFNLAHSWDKSKTSGGKGPWIPSADEPEARSFMNYPYLVAGGPTAFFATFEYRFSDQELLFLRHAPGQFVEPGNALWFDHHGFQGANVLAESTLGLEIRVNRDRPVFEFLEPAILELKLTNRSQRPQILDEHILELGQNVVFIIRKQGGAARQLVPFARYCLKPGDRILNPGESMYAPLFAAVGRNGWDVATPGAYTVQACLQLPTGEDIVSNELRLVVGWPASREDERLAQDFFTEDVGRVIAFHGSRVLRDATTTLEEIAARLPDRRVAVHANLALGSVLGVTYRVLKVDPDAPAGLRFDGLPAVHDEAKERLQAALTVSPGLSVESFGHIRYRESVEQLTTWLAHEDAPGEAARQHEVLYETLASRDIHGHRVLDSVLREVRARQISLEAMATRPIEVR